MLAASQNFIPDVTFKGSALTGWHKLGVEFEASALEFWGKSYDPQGTEAP